MLFLKTYFESNDSGLSSTINPLTKFGKQKSSLIFFTGLLNSSLPVWLFILLWSPRAIALLICMENTFWNIGSDGNFVKLFKKSFTLYVKSGTREKVEADIEKLGYPGRYWEATELEEYKGNFFKIIIEHNLCRFQFLLFAINTSNHFLHLIQLTLVKQKLLGCKTWQQKSVGDNECDGVKFHCEFNCYCDPFMTTC